MNDLTEIYDKVINSEEFKGYESNNKSSYLCSFFLIMDEKEPKPWQLSFYNSSTDTITSFLASDPVKILEKDSKVFKSDHSKLNELNLKRVNIDLKEALMILEKLKIEKYPNELSTKKIIILQKTKQTLWNITYITTSLNLLNIKVDASTGNVLEEKLSSIMGLQEQ